MIFQELKKSAELSINELIQDWKSSDFNQFYEKLLSLHRSFLSTIEPQGLKTNDFTNAHNQFTKQVKGLVAKTDIGSLYVSIHNLKEILTGENGHHPLIEDLSSELRVYLESVWEVLNQISRFPSNFSLVLELIKTANKIEKTFSYFDKCVTFLNATNKLLSKSLHKSEQEEEVIFVFSAEIITLNEFIDKLDALKQIYSEICLIFQIEESNHSLKVGRIESGSLLAKIFGESKVIEFMIWFAKESVKYLHRTYTSEGKMGKLSANVDQLNEQIGLYEKLNAILGKERMSALQHEQAEALQKSAAIITKKYQKLLERETKININNEVLEVQYENPVLSIEGDKKQIAD